MVGRGLVGLVTRKEVKQTKSKGTKRQQLPIEQLHKLGVRGVRNMNSDAKHPDMPPTGAECPVLYVLGEAPGADEDEQAEQFVGKSGRMLRRALDAANIDSDAVRWSNTVRTRPPDNRTPTKTEIECFRPSTIEDIVESKPRVVLAVGKVPTDWFLGSKPIGSMRGRLILTKLRTEDDAHTFWVCPVHHPAYILREMNSQYAEPPGDELRAYFIKDVARAVGLALSDSPVPTPPDMDRMRRRVHVATSVKEIKAALRQWAKAPVVTCDLETNRLRPYNVGAKLLTIAVGDRKRVTAFAVDHPGWDWRDEERKRIHGLLHWFFNQSVPKTFHNLPFDLEWLVVLYGREVAHACEWHDTMQGAYILDERDDGLSLDFECRARFGIDLKVFSDLDRKKLEDANVNDVLPYNGLDVLFTDWLRVRQLKDIKREKLTQVYRDQVDRVPTIVLAQVDGWPVNEEARRKVEKKIERKQSATRARLVEFKPIQTYEKKYGVFNPASPEQVKVLLRDVMKRDEGKRGEKYSTDEKVLESIGEPVCKALLELRTYAKMIGTYLARLSPDHPKSYVWEDGLIHTLFNIAFTNTRRLSSRNPNMQNYPIRDLLMLLIRLVFVAPPRHFILSADYGQLEYRGIGWHSCDKALVKSTWDGYDVHMAWAERYAKDFPSVVRRRFGGLDKKALKRCRTQIKNDMVFPLFYGAEEPHVAKLLHLKANQFQDMYDDFWRMFVGVLTWQEDLMVLYDKTGYTETLTGFRRHGPMSHNKVINSPIQGVASDIVVDAMNRFSINAKEEDKPWLQPRLNIHDDIAFIVPDEKGDEAIEDVVMTMCDSQFDFINTPIQVELKRGTNWKDMTEFMRISSNEVYDERRPDWID